MATYVETATKEQTTQCAEELFQIRRDAESKQRSLGRAPSKKVVNPTNANAFKGGGNASHPLKLVKRSDAVTFEKASRARLAKIRARSKQLIGEDVQFEHQLGKAREECFVVFD